MAIPSIRSLAYYLDPRRSLACAIGWLAFTLSIGLVLFASIWVDNIVRTNLLDQREKQLNGLSDQIAVELNLNLALRLQSMRALAALLSTEFREKNLAEIHRTLENLQSATPEFQWIGIASPQGRIVAATHGMFEGTSVKDQPWFALGLNNPNSLDASLPWVAKSPTASVASAPVAAVDLFAPVIDFNGKILGVIKAQLSNQWLKDLTKTLSLVSRGPLDVQVLVLDQSGRVIIGPASYLGRRWNCTQNALNSAVLKLQNSLIPCKAGNLSGAQLLPDRDPYLVAQASIASLDVVRAFSWNVLVIQRMQDATRRANSMQSKITAILIGLGLLAALLGVVLAHRVTRELDLITRSAEDVRTGKAQRIIVPGGRNEVARLGRAFDELLTSFQLEQCALLKLNAELDQRVATRTSEFEILADKVRYEAVVRERLKIARDLHDTLAHSMMAMLTEIRYLKRLLSSNPSAMAEELVRAEDTAHQGLQEARAAIKQMRFNSVSDAGLAVAMDNFVKLFVERTGISVNCTCDVTAANFSDERAETLFRIFEEAMRNIERHARATKVAISLQASVCGDIGPTLIIADNGIGFDTQLMPLGHYGLAGLREQAKLIGATLTIDSVLQQGTIVKVILASENDFSTVN